MNSDRRDVKKGPSAAFAGVMIAAAAAAGLASCFIQPESLPPGPGDSTGTFTLTLGCGDGECGGDESVETCPADCAVCGDGACSPSEEATCAADCAVCGDGACSPAEDAVTCQADCAVCGDGLCTPLERVSTCISDCTECGDGACSWGESGVTCAEDCPDSGCTKEANQDACLNCLAMAYPSGLRLYNNLATCIVCDACYQACDGEASGCPSKPDMKNPCDSDAPDPEACSDTSAGCTQCALLGDCADEVEACVNSQDCVALVGELSYCPP